MDQDAAGDVCDLDDDGDLDPDATDCAPMDATVRHGATEACNGKDDDCDQAIDPATAFSDAIACTVDVCDGQTVTHTPSDAACDDGKACTVDACAKTGCTHAPVNVDDGLSCTTDACDPVTDAVTHVPVDALCADAGPCTLDVCVEGVGCTHPASADGLPCADGNPCNGDELCQFGTCAPGGALACADADPCTADACDPKLGCVHSVAAPGTPCDDGDACTDGDSRSVTAR